MGKTVKKIVKTLGALFVSILLLNIVAIIFGYRGGRFRNEDGYTDFHLTPNRWMINVEEGFSVLKTDNIGFNNDIVQENVDILFMGSSHLEGHQVMYDQNMATLLGNYTGRNVYNIGVSGHDIYTCLQNIEAASEYFCDAEYIIIETSTIRFNVKDINEALSGTYPEESYNSTMIICLEKYLPSLFKIRMNLLNWINQESDEVQAEYLSDDSFPSYADRVIEMIKSCARDKKVVLVYHPLSELMQDGTLKKRDDEKIINYFRETCELNDIIFLDMTEDFDYMYRTDHVLAHGFANTQIGAGHLNEFGHRAIAERVATVIGEGK